MKIEKEARRFDLGELREATRTPQGFLMIPGFATRVGVFPYRDANGNTRLELRHPDDVFDPVSLATLKHAPVTVEHPPVMLDPTNVALYSKGHTTERVEINRDLVDTDFIIEHQDGIDAVEKEGIRETSCGYFSDIFEESGVYNGAPYDYRQKNIRYNHVALVRRGRAGPEVRLRLDSADAAMKANEFSQESGTNDTDPFDRIEKKKIVITGQEIELTADVADTIQDMLDRYDEMRAKLSQMEDEMKPRKDQKDMDISQPGISPQVNVQQAGPDGRAASGKVGPSDKSGPAKAKGDDDEDEKKDDDDKEKDKKDAEKSEEKDDADPEKKEEKSDAEGPVDKMKKDMEKMRDTMDAMQAKIDEYAAKSMNKPEKKEDRKDSSDVEARIEKRARERSALERQAEKLVPYEVASKFDGMSDDEIRTAVILDRYPTFNAKGKSTVYIQSRFDSIVETVEKGGEERKEAGKHLLGLGNRRQDTYDQADPSSARLKMIQGDREAYKQPLSASKK